MDLFEKFFTLSLRFLSYRPRSEKEVREYLLKKKVAQEIIEEVISKLHEHKFLDDKEFAKMWLESRVRHKHKPIRIIKYELGQKGISREIIDQLLQNSQESKQKDITAIQILITKHLPKYKDLPKHQIYQKLATFLTQKGFSYDLAKRSIDEILKSKV